MSYYNISTDFFMYNIMYSNVPLFFFRKQILLKKLKLKRKKNHLMDMAISGCSLNKLPKLAEKPLLKLALLYLVLNLNLQV